MMMSTLKNRAAYVAGMVTVVAFLAGGCASTSGGEKLAESFSRTRGHLVASQTQINQTLASLNSLKITDSTNLNNAFSQYKKAVEGLEKKGNEARHLAEDLKDNIQMNTLTWQKEMETISDPTVKASVESRKNAVRSNYDQLKMYAQDARAAYEPFLKDNQDIIKALSI